MVDSLKLRQDLVRFGNLEVQCEFSDYHLAAAHCAVTELKAFQHIICCPLCLSSSGKHRTNIVSDLSCVFVRRPKMSTYMSRPLFLLPQRSWFVCDSSTKRALQFRWTQFESFDLSKQTWLHNQANDNKRYPHSSSTTTTKTTVKTKTTTQNIWIRTWIPPKKMPLKLCKFHILCVSLWFPYFPTVGENKFFRLVGDFCCPDSSCSICCSLKLCLLIPPAVCRSNRFIFRFYLHASWCSIYFTE